MRRRLVVFILLLGVLCLSGCHYTSGNYSEVNTNEKVGESEEQALEAAAEEEVQKKVPQDKGDLKEKPAEAKDEGGGETDEDDALKEGAAEGNEEAQDEKSEAEESLQVNKQADQAVKKPKDKKTEPKAKKKSDTDKAPVDADEAQAQALALAQMQAALEAQNNAAQPSAQTRVETGRTFVEDCGMDSGYWIVTYSDGTSEIVNE